jgi:hypothetical protein
MSLHELAVYKHSILLRSKTGEKQFSFLLNSDLVLLRCADGEFITLGQFEREHTKVFHQRLAVNPDFEIADELIEREVDLMLLLDSDEKTEFHDSRKVARASCP